MNTQQKLFIALILSFLSHSFLAYGAPKMSLRDKEYKKNHLKNLGRKKGYQGNKDWSNFLAIAKKYEDKDVLGKMLSITPNNRTERAQYVLDLFSIHKEKPEFFVKTSYEFFGNDMGCVARLFKHFPAILEENELSDVYKAAKKPSTLFTKFMDTHKRTDLSKVDMKKETKQRLKCQKNRDNFKL